MKLWSAWRVTFTNPEVASLTTGNGCVRTPLTRDNNPAYSENFTKIEESFQVENEKGKMDVRSQHNKGPFDPELCSECSLFMIFYLLSTTMGTLPQQADPGQSVSRDKQPPRIVHTGPHERILIDCQKKSCSCWLLKTRIIVKQEQGCFIGVATALIQ